MKIIPLKHTALAFTALILLVFNPNVHADSAQEIDIKVDDALERFAEEVNGGKVFLQQAKGVLVFPSVLKAGFGIGGEYGEGALRIGGKSVDYYNTAGVSFGLQIGAQAKTMVIVFLEDSALTEFRNSKGWEAGVDGSIAIAKWGAGENVTSTEFDDPIVAFVFGNKGLMYNLTIEGSKFTKLVR